MPAAPNRSGIRTGLAIAGAGALCIGAGWWLGQLQGGSAGSDPSRTALERQASSLQQRLNQGEASQAEQQRLLELLVALDRKAEATALLERLADQQPQQWSLRLLPVPWLGQPSQGRLPAQPLRHMLPATGSMHCHRSREGVGGSADPSHYLSSSSRTFPRSSQTVVRRHARLQQRRDPRHRPPVCVVPV